jgi:hypothetical protein
MSNYAFIESTTLVKAAAGKIKGIFVSAASSTPTITIYDSDTISGSAPTVLGVFTPVASTNYNFFDGLFLNKGLRVEIGGTVKCTIAFE